MRNGIRASVGLREDYNGYGINIIKYQDGKIYCINLDSIEWKETKEFAYMEPLLVSEFTDNRSESQKGNLYGENQALKNEVKFLREQISKLLDKV